MNFDYREPSDEGLRPGISGQPVSSDKTLGGEDSSKVEITQPAFYCSNESNQLLESEVYRLLSKTSDQPLSCNKTPCGDNSRKDEITQTYLDRSNEFTRLLKSSEIKIALHNTTSMSIWIEINRDNHNHKVAILRHDQTVRAWNSINRYKKYSNPSTRPFGTSLLRSLISSLLRVVFGDSDIGCNLNTTKVEESPSNQIKLPIYILSIYNRKKVINYKPDYQCALSVFYRYSYVSDILFTSFASPLPKFLTRRFENNIKQQLCRTS